MFTNAPQNDIVVMNKNDRWIIKMIYNCAGVFNCLILLEAPPTFPSSHISILLSPFFYLKMKARFL